MLPRVTHRCLLVGETIQSAHVSLVELLLVLCLKVVADVSDVEACASALHLQINPIEIAKAYVVDHYRDGLAGNRKGCPLHIAPFGCQAGIANDISDVALSAEPRLFLGYAHVETRRSKKRLADSAAIDMHFLIGFAIRIDVEQHRWERPWYGCGRKRDATDEIGRAWLAARGDRSDVPQ